MTDELFERKVRRDLRRLADELPVPTPSRIAQRERSLPAIRSRRSRWSRRHRPGYGHRPGHRRSPGARYQHAGYRQHPAGEQRAAWRGMLPVAALVAAVAAMLLAAVAVVPGHLLRSHAVRLGNELPTAALTQFPGALAYVADGALHAAEPGASPRSVASVANPVSGPQWSSDSRWLAYAGSSGHLHVVSTDGAANTIVTPNPVAAFAWSPRANLLAVLPASGSQAGDLLLVHVGGGTATAALVASGVWSFVWSSGGREIAYSKAGAGNQSDRLFLYDVVTGGRQLLPYVPPPGTGVLLGSFWPDGGGLVMWVDPGRSIAAEATGLELVSLPLAASLPLPLVRTFVYLPWLAWSPGGSRLLTVQMSKASPWEGSNLVVCRPSRGSCRVLTQPRHVVTVDPAWSPGGRRIAFVRASAMASPTPGVGLDWWYATRRLWVAMADGTGAREVTGAGQGVAEPRFGASGKSIFYVTAHSVKVVPAAGGRATTVAGGLSGALGTGGPDGYGKLPWGGLAEWGP